MLTVHGRATPMNADFTLPDIETGLPLCRDVPIPTNRLDRPTHAACHARLTGRPARVAHVMVPRGLLKDHPLRETPQTPRRAH